MKVSVFGIGYVGLVQAAALAESGHDVMCVDVDVQKVEALKKGRIPIFEPGLETLVTRNIANGRLNFTSDPRHASQYGEVLFIAVGTPPDESGAADLQYVLAVAQTIGENIEAGAVVVTKSTVPVGTGDKVQATLRNALAGRGKGRLRVHVVSNPEFMKEGSAVTDCLKPDRIVIGTDSEAAEAKLRELYAPFNRSHEKFIVMDRRSAELTKYAANCMLATKISFMNEIAMIADRLGADVERVRQGIGSDPRIGYHFIYSGIGYGGSCFPKDVEALIHSARQAGSQPLLLDAVRDRNAAQKHVLFAKINAYFDGDLRGRTFALWGLAFKPNTDDMREAPSRILMESLWAAGARVRAYDPEAMVECARIYGARDELVLTRNKEEALIGADALVVVTEWKAFQAPDFELVHDTLTEPVVFDGRNIYDPVLMARYGLSYFGIGRRQLHQKPALTLVEAIPQPA
jgi:UDPglucose 6-dehydrogenase